MLKRVLVFVASVVVVGGGYYGCGRGYEDKSATESYRDVVEIRACADGVRYWVVCMDGRTEYRNAGDLQADNVCLERPRMQVNAPGGTWLGRIASGPNCLLPNSSIVQLTQPPTMLNAVQAVVQPQAGSIAGCNITAGVVLRSDVEFLAPDYPSYPSIPSFPSNPDYPCG